MAGGAAQNGVARAPCSAPWAKEASEVADELGVDPHIGLSADEVAARQEKYGFNELEKEPGGRSRVDWAASTAGPYAAASNLLCGCCAAGKPMWKLVLEQFDDMLVKILLLAALVSFAIAYFEEGSAEEGLRAYIEPFVILAILVLNAIVGVWQASGRRGACVAAASGRAAAEGRAESNAERALEALKDLQSDSAHVIRGGKAISDLPARELVPGDVVELTVGDKVPADVRLVSLKTATLRAEQSSLTGEPVAVLKGLEPTADANCELQAKECMVFAGSAIANGAGTGIVVATGMGTEIGKIQSDIQAASEEEMDTPLKQRLDEFGGQLANVIFVVCVVVWAINYHHFVTIAWVPGSFLPDWAACTFNLAKCTYYFKIAVALAVAAIPEGLPAVITTCLALGTRKMAKKNAIVRKLPSVETLGCTTVICSDKTGTLTTNQMSVVTLVTISADGTGLRQLEVAGTTYNPDQGSILGLPSDGLDAGLAAVAEVCAECNESRIECKGGAFKAVGAPTEAALKVLAEKLGLPDRVATDALVRQRLNDPEAHPEPICAHICGRLQRLALLEFDRDRKSMSVICRQEAPPGRIVTRHSGGNVLLVKGAAECILERCDRVLLPDGREGKMGPLARATLMSAVDSMADRALRILALARRPDLPSDLATFTGDTKSPGGVRLQNSANYESIESGLVFVGLVGLQDPPRPEVPGAIADCANAGVRVIVITGDNKTTAEAICRKIGVLEEGADAEGRSFTGREFVEMPRERQLAVLGAGESLVFSRAEPRHKQDIVRLLKDMGEVTAMTGDGVNDAPALKLADIGIAMGIAGTEVAKEASDMVLADDNFSTIVAAVAEGRAIYANMKAFIRYMISSNIGEVASIFLTAILGLPEGLIPVQLLWVNLVTDGPPATALGFNPPDVDIMLKPPRDPREQLITPWVYVRYMVIGSAGRDGQGCRKVG
ncbi:calcium-transporting ATPase, endoplasmic reticulum-type [Monoraphidium neglectum]|uniref:P-type Ca(2+) transporter n=1 Tax=Monoraphidium neglectum TaxID=145388 RepID=A0A0D2MNN4_9CHLO|nr:calcium-transporting ATPase, endoplasmic reticulum-type [Monoraphidium neglectum]KIZ04315.1 calcium-transporting ATPase, endoplasmic reticulum-type [Monoraphidium neglectum]|eukprot:XP_013903334.1 calcium-transporting ATPase, endoplasmic reticulum-type [Monoraphidium neglectum]